MLRCLICELDSGTVSEFDGALEPRTGADMADSLLELTCLLRLGRRGLLSFFFIGASVGLS